MQNYCLAELIPKSNIASSTKLMSIVQFFKKGATQIFAVETDHGFSPAEQEKLSWLLSGAKPLASKRLSGRYIGPRREMITP